MSKRRQLLIRLREEDLRRLDITAEALGGVSRAAAIRFSINNNTLTSRKNNHNDIQMIIPTKPP